MPYVIHILVAALLGGAIGIERGYRAKEAGFRTHFLVALGAALFMILSAHGFDGVLISENHRLDVSRIAAQVVSGIGFIGAGTIIFQRHAVHGLTTAAGLWVTAAIGMAAGAGLYMLASFTTVLVLIGLEVLNSLLPHVSQRSVTLAFTTAERSALQTVLDHLRTTGATVVSFSQSASDAPAEKATGAALEETVKSAMGGAMETESGQAFTAPQHVKMEVRIPNKRYGQELLRFLTEQEGICIESVE